MADPTTTSKEAARLDGPFRPKQQDVCIEPATPYDADCIKNLVISAYSKYVERMGREPAPMTASYHAIIQDESQDVYVLRASQDGRVLGSILLSDHQEDDAVKVNNLVVDPAAQGSGYGKQLMNFAEEVARGKGRGAITLFTNEKMYENIALYPKLGFVETDRRTEDGYHRVYFRKPLSAVIAAP